MMLCCAHHMTMFSRGWPSRNERILYDVKIR